MKRTLSIAGLLLLVGVVLTCSTFLAVRCVDWHYTYVSPEEQAARSLGSGAVCAEEHDRVTVCVFDGVEYRCVRDIRRDAVACARRTP